MTEPQPAPVTIAGFRGPEACAAAGVTYRQLDYWCRTELVVPTVRAAVGSGTQRLYSREDVVALKVVKSLLDAGMSLQVIRDNLTGILDPDRASDSYGRVVQITPYVLSIVDVAAVSRSVPEPPVHRIQPEPPRLAVVP